VLRIGLFAAFHAVFLGVIVLVVPAEGQVAARLETVSEVPLPGGLRAALASIGDNAAPDRAQFLAEFIRRMYDTPLGARGDMREPFLRALLSEILASKGPVETIPLPLSQKIWIDVVFRGETRPDTLVTAILQSRNASLFYVGLLSLDDESRAWIAGQTSLISEIASRRAAGFLVAAPAFRVAAGAVRLPGGPAAEPVWQALVGKRPSEPTEFLRALVSADEGRLAYFYASMAQLTPSQIEVALNLGAADGSKRVDAGHRLYVLFEKLWIGRAIEQRVFTRPSFDPALLASQLSAQGDATLSIPGTRGFWSAVFSEASETPGKAARAQAATIPWDQPPDFVWLCEQVFKGDQPEHRRHFVMVLFAARHAAGVTKETSHDALDAVRAVAAYPALMASLERAGITDIPVFAAAARRAAALSVIEDDARASRALSQYQGALAMITRAASRGSLTAQSATKLASSLTAIDTDDRGDYAGRIVAWLGGWLGVDGRSAPQTQSSAPAANGSVEEVYDSAAGPMEEDALRVLAGRAAAMPRLVDWEGTRYRVDLARAEAVRITNAQTQSTRPYLSAAWAIISVADALADQGLTRQALQQQAEAYERLWQQDSNAGGNEPAGDVFTSHREIAMSMKRAAGSGDLRAAARLVPSMRLLADELTARGLLEWAFAAALGPRDGISISAADAANRHDFGLRGGPGGRAVAWRFPIAGTDFTQRWRVTGSLLGLDVTLADFSLMKLSSKFPPRKPTLSEVDRHVFIDTIALVRPTSLTDQDRDAIATAIRNGRSRLNAVRSPADVRAIADIVGLSAQRETLLSWTVTHEPARVAAFLSPSELFWLGAGDVVPPALDAWGAPAGSRLGCLCLQVLPPRPWEIFAGRWNTGMSASAFPDLNLRLAELLSDLHMPAVLLGPVLTAATLDFVNSATSRDPDDRRGLAEFVQSLKTDRVEQYLALLTTDGPLVPLGDSPVSKDPAGLESAANAGRSWR
jgi:hypothetical protein